jgi:hypothetical protein
MNRDKDAVVYLAPVTFGPDFELNEAYVPHGDSGLRLVEICDTTLRIWRIGITVEGGIFSLKTNARDVARPEEVRDARSIVKFLNDNNNLFF